MSPLKEIVLSPRKKILLNFLSESKGQSVSHSFFPFLPWSTYFSLLSLQLKHGNQIDFVVLDPSYCIFSISFQRGREAKMLTLLYRALLCCSVLWKISRASGVGHSPHFCDWALHGKSKTQIKTRPFLRLVISATRKKCTLRFRQSTNKLGSFVNNF